MRRTAVILVVLAILSIGFYYGVHYWLESKPFVVELTDNGFKPEWLKISRNDSVLFINTGKLSHWPASDDHPFHGLCPGFDVARPLNPGESYVFKFYFNKLPHYLCPYHDHLYPNNHYVIEIIK